MCRNTTETASHWWAPWMSVRVWLCAPIRASPRSLTSRASDLTSARSRSLAGATHSPSSARPVQTRVARQTLRLKSTQETVCPHSLAVLVRHADTRVFSIDPGAHSPLLSLLFSPVPICPCPLLSAPPPISLTAADAHPTLKPCHPSADPASAAAVQPQCSGPRAADTSSEIHSIWLQLRLQLHLFFFHSIFLSINVRKQSRCPVNPLVVASGLILNGLWVAPWFYLSLP